MSTHPRIFTCSGQVEEVDGRSTLIGFFITTGTPPSGSYSPPMIWCVPTHLQHGATIKTQEPSSLPQRYLSSRPVGLTKVLDTGQEPDYWLRLPALTIQGFTFSAIGKIKLPDGFTPPTIKLPQRIQPPSPRLDLSAPAL